MLRRRRGRDHARRDPPLAPYQPRIAPMISPSTNRPPARRVTRKDIAANHNGHTGFGIGDVSGFGFPYAAIVRRRTGNASTTSNEATGRTRAMTSATTDTEKVTNM